MSRIVALLNRDGRPMEPEILRRLVAPLRIRGSDGPRFWMAGSAGLAYQCLQASLAIDDLQPAKLAPALSICFDGRLDNRADLIRELRPDLSAEPAALPDAHLVMACYRQFGDLFAAKLNGDYALALFDMERQQMVLSRDVMGVRPLYYLESRERLVAASEIKAILAHPGIDARPDNDALADLLVGGDPYDLRRTLFRDVRRVLPGHTLFVGSTTFRELKHWDFDPLRQVRCGSVAEYAEALRGLFGQAVRRRLRSQAAVAVTVSGGLDSSAILCEAEMLRRTRAGIPPAHGISRLYPEGSPSDEKGYLVDIEKQYGVHIRRLPPSPIRFVDGNEWPWRIEYPMFEQNDAVDSLNLARELSCSTVLDGYYGDQIMWSPAHLFDLLRGLRWVEASKALRALAGSMTDQSPHALRQELLHAFVRDLVPDWLMRPYRVIRRLAARDRSENCYSAALRDAAFRRRQQQRRPARHVASRHAEYCYRLAHAAHVAREMELSNKVAAHCGLDLAYPFADRDLIAFVMAIPGEIVTCGGIYKGLFREATRGILPESIRRRTWKADFTLLGSDAAAELSRSGLEANLGPGSLAVNGGYVDAAALPVALARLKARLGGENMTPAMQLTQLLAFEFWLRAFFANGHSGILQPGQKV